MQLNHSNQPIIDELKTEGSSAHAEIETLRREIDGIHQQLFDLILIRLQTSEKIWLLKKQNSIQWDDFAREQSLIEGLCLEEPMGLSLDEMKRHEHAKILYRQIAKLLIAEGKKILKQRLEQP